MKDSRHERSLCSTLGFFLFSFLFFSFTYPLSILISGFSLVTTLFFPLLSLTWLHLVTICIYV